MRNLLHQSPPPSKGIRPKWYYRRPGLFCLLVAALCCLAIPDLLAQQAAITGKVTGENGEGLPGVTVLVKGTATGTTTVADGGFSLNAPSATATLVVSFIGYVTQEVPLNNQRVVAISL